MSGCSVCGGYINKGTTSGLCWDHYRADLRSRHRHCGTCDKRIDHDNISGFCITHRGHRAPVDGRPILVASSEATGVRLSRILGPEQSVPIVDARAVAAAALYHTGCTMVGIGDIMARDHSTICHLVRGFDGRALKRPHLRDALDRVLAA